MTTLEDRAAIVRVLYEAGRAMTADEIAAATGMKSEHVRSCCFTGPKERSHFIRVAPRMYDLRASAREAYRLNLINEARKAATRAALDAQDRGRLIADLAKDPVRRAAVVSVLRDDAGLDPTRLAAIIAELDAVGE